MASNPYFNNFIPAGSQQAAGTQAYGASAGPSPGYPAGGHSASAAGQTSYDTAYPNTAAFAGYYGFPAKHGYEPKNYFPGPPGTQTSNSPLRSTKTNATLSQAGPGKPDTPGLPPAHYQGYEGALFNAAATYLHHPKPGSMPAGPHMGAKPGPGGPKARGRYYAPGGGGGGGGGYHQRWTNPSTQQLHYCEVCKISCASPQTYKDHLDGQKHKKKEAAVRSGLPMVPTPRTGAALHCELCNVTCTSSDAYAAHIRGTKHQKVVKLHTKLGKPIPPAEPQLIHSKPSTSTSSTTTTSTSSTAPASSSHDTSPKTNGAEEAPAASAASTASTKSVADVPMTAAVATETALSVLAQMEEEKSIQPVGQDYVEELRGPDGKINGFNCRLCECRFNDVNAKDMHLKGRRHRLMYKKKVDPNLIVEAKGWPSQRKSSKTVNWQERKKGDYWEGGEAYDEMPGAAMEDGQPRPPFWPNASRGMRHGGPPSMGMPPPPQYFPTCPVPLGMPAGGIRKPESLEDRHVMAKHAEIYPSELELDTIQTLVSYVERALKLVSDQLTNQPDDAVKQASDGAAADGHHPAPQRMLKGVMRVGLLAKGLLLKGDRAVQLVVLCSQPPTFHLLDRVAEALPVHLTVIQQSKLINNLSNEFNFCPQAVAPSVTFAVEPQPEEAHVLVKSSGHALNEVTIKVSLTSPVVREEQLAAAAALSDAAAACADVEMKDPAASKDARLNTKDCLHALALLRRAKWFQARANSLQNCVLVIRIMRDFGMRSPIWSTLDLWAMELIVERSTFSAGAPLSPGDALRRVFETLSAGILLTNNDGWSPGVGDPCEKDAVDATCNLTPQEREDMTASAQQALRQIAFRQVFKVLGMAKALQMGPRNAKAGPSPGKKRPRENSQSDAVSPEGETPADLKKEKIEGQEA
nr:EOG090X037N [Moina brachiata]